MTKNLVFIDSRVSNYQTLIASLGAETKWVLLDATQDGVLQMQATLAGYSGLDSIQVVSHGSPGTLYLGSTVLTNENLASYSGALAGIGASLTESGDILLYGCSVGAGDKGQAFIEAFARATGADVAASVDATGAEALGGDWALEQRSGDTETDPIPSEGFASLLIANSAPTFTASTGKVSIDFGNGSGDTAQTVATQADGKILVGGSTSLGAALVRFNQDGSLDTSFSGDGKLVADPSGGVVSIAIQTDGKVLALVNSYLLRYNPDGTLDSSFSGDGKVGFSVTANSVVVQADGKIVVTGNSPYSASSVYDIAVERYNTDGSLDTSFDGDGKVKTDVGSDDNGKGAIVQTDGKILVGGYRWNSNHLDFALVRYNIDGSLDGGFGTDGIVITDIGKSERWSVDRIIAIQPDGKILMVAPFNNVGSYDFLLVRYNADGTMDTSFSGDGKVTTDFDFASSDAAMSVAVQLNGKILVTGWGGSDDIAVARYNVDGSLDTSFDSDGKVTTDLFGREDYGNSICVQNDGRILAAGTTAVSTNSSNGNWWDFALVRYNTDGSLDTSFSPPQDTLQQRGPASYTENNASVVLAPAAQILDAELAAAGNYSGTTLTLSRHNGSSTQDVFAAKSGGTLTTLTTGSYFSVDGVTIGRVTTNGSGTLTLTFNANATQSLVNSAMQQIAYANTSDAPPASAQIDWTFNDGNTGAQGTGGALSVTGSTTVQITATNDAPYLATSIPDLSVEANSSLNYVIPATTFVDVDGDALYWSMAMADGTGVPPWLTFNPVTKVLSGTPSTEDAGTLALHFTATDPVGASATDYVNVTVTVNTPPTLSISTLPPSTYEVEYNDDRTYATAFTSAAAGHLSSTNDVDWFSVYLNAPGMQTVTVDTSSMSFGSWNVYWYAPNMQVLSGRNIGPSSDTSIFTYEIVAQVNGTYSLRMQPTHPTLYNGGQYNVYLGAPDQLTYTDTATDDSFVNKTGTLIGSDVDANTTLTYGISSGTDNGTTVSKTSLYGTLTVTKSTGAFVYVPNDAGIESLKNSVTDPFTMTVSDGQATTTAAYTLQLTGADDTTAFSGTVIGTVVEDGTNTALGTLSVSDRDTGDAAITAQTNVAGTYGKFTIHPNGQWSYALDNAAANVQSLKQGQSTTDTFVVATAGGASQSIVVTVNGTNDVAVAANASSSTTEDTLLTGAVNATDADADVLTYSAATQPSHGAVVVTPNGGYTYTPAANYFGPDSFTFKANDGRLDSNVATVLITVNPVNDAPSATNLSAAESYTEDTPLNLTNIVISDVDSANVTATLTLSSAAAGALSTTTSGSVTSTYNAGTGVWSASGAIANVNTLLAGVTFNPALNFNANFTVTTSVSDGVAPALTSTKSFTGTNINDAPSGTVTIAGTAVQGQTLTASNTLADPDGLGTISYQWLADGMNIQGATGTTLKLEQAQVDKVITVSASYTDGFATPESKISNATPVVSEDAQPPTANTFNPADAATDIPIGATITVTFSEAVQSGTGEIVLKTADGAVVATYPPGSPNLSFSGNTLTLNPTANLKPDTGYKVEIAAGSVQDLAGNPYAGTKSYDFTTGPRLTVGDAIVSVYTGMYNRAPDQEGLVFWQGAVQNQYGLAMDAAVTDLSFQRNMVEQFAKFPTYYVLYKDMSDETFVGQLYLNLQNRTGEADGQAYWLGRLDGTVDGENDGPDSREKITADFIYGTLSADYSSPVFIENFDPETLAAAQAGQDAARNKIDVAKYYTQVFGELSNYGDIVGSGYYNPDPNSPTYEADAYALQDWLEMQPPYANSTQSIAGVTDDYATVASSKALVDTLYADAAGGQQMMVTLVGVVEG